MYYVRKQIPDIFEVGHYVNGDWRQYKVCEEIEAEDLVNKLNGGSHDPIPEPVKSFLLDIVQPRRGSNYDHALIEEFVIADALRLVEKYKIKY